MRRATGQDLLHWAETLSGIARTGLGFTESLYERERYEEVIRVAAEIRTTVHSDADVETVAVEMMRSVGSGVPGYVTPKVAIGAVVGNDDGEILLVQRADSGVWLFPTGWADVGYSASEVAVKEVYEETGIECEPLSLISLVDGLRQGFTLPLPSHRWCVADPSPRDLRRRLVRAGRSPRAVGGARAVGGVGVRSHRRQCGSDDLRPAALAPLGAGLRFLRTSGRARLRP